MAGVCCVAVVVLLTMGILVILIVFVVLLDALVEILSVKSFGYLDAGYIVGIICFDGVGYIYCGYWLFC